MFTETTRLIIRDVQRADLLSLLAISSDPEVFRTNDVLPADEAKLREWLDDTIAHNAQAPRRSHTCAIVLKATDQVIGWVGFIVPSDLRKDNVDFGYAINRAYWNQGYMTEAVRTMLAYCFDVIGASAVSAYHMKFNPSSGKVMQKAGMRLDDVMMAGRTDDEVHYIITAHDSHASQHPNN